MFSSNKPPLLQWPGYVNITLHTQNDPPKLSIMVCHWGCFWSVRSREKANIPSPKNMLFKHMCAQKFLPNSSVLLQHPLFTPGYCCLGVFLVQQAKYSPKSYVKMYFLYLSGKNNHHLNLSYKETNVNTRRIFKHLVSKCILDNREESCCWWLFGSTLFGLHVVHTGVSPSRKTWGFTPNFQLEWE